MKIGFIFDITRFAGRSGNNIKIIFFLSLTFLLTGCYSSPSINSNQIEVLKQKHTLFMIDNNVYRELAKNYEHLDSINIETMAVNIQRYLGIINDKFSSNDFKFNKIYCINAIGKPPYRDTYDFYIYNNDNTLKYLGTYNEAEIIDSVAEHYYNPKYADEEINVNFIKSKYKKELLGDINKSEYVFENSFFDWTRFCRTLRIITTDHPEYETEFSQALIDNLSKVPFIKRALPLNQEEIFYNPKIFPHLREVINNYGPESNKLILLKNWVTNKTKPLDMEQNRIYSSLKNAKIHLYSNLKGKYLDTIKTKFDSFKDSICSVLAKNYIDYILPLEVDISADENNDITIKSVFQLDIKSLCTKIVVNNDGIVCDFYRIVLDVLKSFSFEYNFHNYETIFLKKDSKESITFNYYYDNSKSPRSINYKDYLSPTDAAADAVVQKIMELRSQRFYSPIVKYLDKKNNIYQTILCYKSSDDPTSYNFILNIYEKENMANLNTPKSYFRKYFGINNINY